MVRKWRDLVFIFMIMHDICICVVPVWQVISVWCLCGGLYPDHIVIRACILHIIALHWVGYAFVCRLYICVLIGD